MRLSLARFIIAALAWSAGAACSSNDGVTSTAEATDASPAPVDAGVAEAGDAQSLVEPDGGFDAALPDSLERLSQTGLYDDIAQKSYAANALPFVPAHVLWSDAAEKRRFIVLPPGATIDTSDMNHWRFPLGTRFFKEFLREGKRLETRLIYRRASTGNPEVDFWAGAFAWRDDESEADFVVDGKTNVRATDHDVPAQTKCFACHVGEPGRILGFSALQLSKPGPGLTLKELATNGWLSAPPPNNAEYPAPGDATMSSAIGYFHANCGHCHNPSGTAWPDTKLVLRLGVEERDPNTTALVKATVGIALDRWTKTGFSVRIDPGSAATSGIVERMKARGTTDQMPPLATKHADSAGIAAVSAWIDSL